MPLYFTDKKKRWPPPKAVQYLLAVLALLTAGAILILWLRVFMTTEPSASSNTPSTTATSVESVLPDTGYCLLIIEDAGFERFALIEFAPTAGSITVQSINPDLAINDTETVLQLYRRTKAAQVTNALATHYQLPLEHYISLSINELETMVTDWGRSLSMTPPEEITYHDENGALVRLPAEKNAMTSKQIGAMLHHTQWQNPQSSLLLTAELTVSLINHLLTPNRDLNNLYNTLADHSSVRVQHFNAFAQGLAHLAALNNGTLAQSGAITGA